MEKFNEIKGLQPDKLFFGYKSFDIAFKNYAIDTLIVTDGYIRKLPALERKDLSDKMKELKLNKIKVCQFSSLHFTGEKIDEFGGICGILKFIVEELAELSIEENNDEKGEKNIEKGKKNENLNSIKMKNETLNKNKTENKKEDKKEEKGNNKKKKVKENNKNISQGTMTNKRKKNKNDDEEEEEYYDEDYDDDCYNEEYYDDEYDEDYYK